MLAQRPRAYLLPTRATVCVVAAWATLASIALLWGVPLSEVAPWAALASGLTAAWVLADAIAYRWRPLTLRVERQLPQALAIGVPKVLTLTLINEGARSYTVQVFDDTDPSLDFQGMPQRVRVPAQASVSLHYTVTPRRRGPVSFGWPQVRVQGPWGGLEFNHALGEPQSLSVFPNFAAVAGYAWLAGDRRLAQIGIKAYTQRGMGTDFKQLTDYQVGDPIRHIDWKATLKHARPIVRQFQDERDQRVLFLLDCGRRMRADEGTHSVDGSHFDQALNALMLLSYVALKEGDAVGAMTFATPPGQQRHFAPRKGGASLNAIMARLHDLQPTATHSDYLMAAQEVMRLQPKRALVIVLTNFRDEDATELQPALALMRTRHLVMLASLREKVLRQTCEKPMRTPEDIFDIAAAHRFTQTRQDALGRAVGRDALVVDVEASQLAVALVNRYHAVKKAGML
jgi:uncharacterized protein (DUF58 family)